MRIRFIRSTLCIGHVSPQTVIWLLALNIGLMPITTTPAWGQTTPNGVSKDMTAEACKRDVLRFEEAIGFVRQSQGPEAAAALKEKLLPAAVANDLLMKEGYCGIARHLKEKKLDR